MEHKKIVLSFDICSSTYILEDLLRTENIQSWKDFLNWLKKYLIRRSKELKFDLYKFTGDGWIILFDFDYSGIDLIAFLEDLCEQFQRRFDCKVANLLETPPEVVGISFGMDRGTLIPIIYRKSTEYVGRAINVACRLQAAIKDKDKNPQYKILMTRHLFNALRTDLRDYKCSRVRRKLRNIDGNRVVHCVKVCL